MKGEGSLKTYHAKRDFERTPEPRGKISRTKGRRFIVQKHEATRLHYDLRLEIDGVLKSWAVTKGPSLDPADKRLAVRTEDHPLGYADFEGVIPKGEYGGGTVMLWDSGSWEPVEGKSAADLADGHLHFRLEGQRMKGEWLLVRMRPNKGEKRENWLLRKIDDEAAGASDDLVERHLTSVRSARSMAEIAADRQGGQSRESEEDGAVAGRMKKAAARGSKRASPGEGARSAKTRLKPPSFRKLQLATLVDAVPAGNGWFHEIKYDGYRALIAAAGAKIAIYTRSGLDWTERFASLVEPLAALDLPPCLIDGEIVAFGKDGNPQFSALQAELKRRDAASADLHFFAFDLLELDGASLAKLGNLERKERLEALLREAGPPIELADHVIGAGERLYKAMCSAGQEGIISKRIDASYAARRSRNWVKVKCTRRQEFVIAGWKESASKGRAFASLVLAQHDNGKLVYKGNVGTGFDAETMAMLERKLRARARKTPPLEVDAAAARKVHWVRPDLVAEIAFAEFTASGLLRHASFLGLRADKEASDVTPDEADKVRAKAEIAISNRERVIFPDARATKGDLADYYAALGPLMLPYMAHRPVSLVRCPQGRAKKCFFQKHDAGSFGQHVRHVPIKEKGGGVEDYLFVEDARGILACVQMGTIEFHGWGSLEGDVEHPDRMVFDLDPGDGVDFGAVKKAALDIHRELAHIGLQSFAMLTGGKGVHLVVPLDRGHGWDAHKDFSKRFAEALSLAEPDRFVATMSKAKRKGKIFIDYLRNSRGSTAIMPYSVRAREGAPVAVPIGWDALSDAASAHDWTIGDAEKLLERASSPDLKGWGFARQSLPDM